MRSMTKRWRLALAGAACYIGVAVFFAPAAARQEEKLQPPDKEEGGKVKGKGGPTRQYTGSSSCSGPGSGCHFNKFRELPGGQPDEDNPAEPTTCRGIEGDIWREYDAHTLAYTAINTDLKEDARTKR